MSAAVLSRSQPSGGRFSEPLPIFSHIHFHVDYILKMVDEVFAVPVDGISQRRVRGLITSSISKRNLRTAA